MIAALIALGARLLTGAIPRWRGCLPRIGKRIYFANHTSNLDLVLLWASLPPDCRREARPVAAHDYWTKSRFRQWLAASVFHAVLIERKHVSRENNPLGPMLAVLQAGQALIIFPEGTRNPSGELGPFKPGVFHLARQTPDAELIPVYLENLNRVLPKGEVLPVPLLCSVHFGAPLQLQPGETKPAFLERARAAILTLRQA